MLFFIFQNAVIINELLNLKKENNASIVELPRKEKSNEDNNESRLKVCYNFLPHNSRLECSLVDTVYRKVISQLNCLMFERISQIFKSGLNNTVMVSFGHQEKLKGQRSKIIMINWEQSPHVKASVSYPTRATLFLQRSKF